MTQPDTVRAAHRAVDCPECGGTYSRRQLVEHHVANLETLFALRTEDGRPAIDAALRDNPDLARRLRRALR